MSNGGWGPPPGGSGGGYGQPQGFGQPPGGYGQPPGFGQPPGGYGPPPGMPPGWQPNHQALDGGIPWESSAGNILGRWWSTLGAILKGRPFFAAAATSDDAMSAVTFHAMTFAMFGALVGLVYFVIFSLIGTAFLAVLAPLTKGLGGMFAGGAVMAGAAFWFAAIVCGGVGGFVLPWLTGGIHHVVLALLGGVPPDRSYSHTVRAHAYANGGATVFAVIPYLGALVSFGLGIKNHLEAYDEMHHCGGGRALAAYVAPVVCSCCGCVGGLGLFGSVASALSP
jgi:hypothetical protein